MKKKMLLLLVAVLLGMGGTAKKQTAAPVSFAHPWTGKRVAYIGDSVSDPNVKQTDGMKHYWDFLAEWLSTTPLVYATNGHTLKNGLSNVDRLHAERGDSVDVIVVFLGTNDFNAGISLSVGYEFASHWQVHLCVDWGVTDMLNVDSHELYVKPYKIGCQVAYHFL